MTFGDPGSAVQRFHAAPRPGYHPKKTELVEFLPDLGDAAREQILGNLPLGRRRDNLLRGRNRGVGRGRAYIGNGLRFRDHTNALFKKHGMEIVGFWTDEKRPEVLIYILAFPSKDAADKSWREFREDRDWQQAKADSEKDGALVTKVESVFMNPTDYSPIK